MKNALAKAIFVSGTPLSVVEHPLWIQFFKSIRSSFTLPSRKSLATTQLDKQYNEMLVKITSKIESSKNLSLQCDGWTNIRNEPIINFVITTPEPLFHSFLSTKENRHTGEYMAEQIDNLISKYNPEKFFVVIGDNAANMQKAFALIHAKYPHIITLGCMAHTLHLLCNDILNCPSVKVFMGSVTNIIKAVRNTHVLNALFKRLSMDRKSNVTLKLPCSTRWGSSLFSLESLQACKVTLQKLAVDETVQTILQKEIKLKLLDDSVFWVRVDKMIDMLKPIVTWITRLESNACSIHKVHSALQEIEHKLSELLPRSPLTKAEEEKVKEKMSERKTHAVGKIHFAASLLDPSSQGSQLSPEEQVDAMEFIHNVGVVLKVNSEQLMIDMANYRSKEGLWKKDFIWASADKMSPTVWWQGLCGTTILSEVAVRILSAPVTSAATERTFSTFSWIHNKRRNRLTTERAGKLTYLSHNWKLLNKEEEVPATPRITFLGHTTTHIQDDNNDNRRYGDTFAATPSSSKGPTNREVARRLYVEDSSSSLSSDSEPEGSDSEGKEEEVQITWPSEESHSDEDEIV